MYTGTSLKSKLGSQLQASLDKDESSDETYPFSRARIIRGGPMLTQQEPITTMQQEKEKPAYITYTFIIIQPVIWGNEGKG